MSDRFFVEQPIRGQTVDLAGDEARHLTAVMRAAVGDEVTLFDGGGAEFVARIGAIMKHSVHLDILERREVSRELPFIFSLAVALPKGDRQKWLLEKTTELGVTRLIPLITERGVAQPVESALDRLRRGVIEASKQCGRNRLMEIAEPRRAVDLFADQSIAGARLIAHFGGQALNSTQFRSNAGLIAAIGPEGGFTDGEVATANAADWRSISLGSRILRVETAAIAVAAWAAMGAAGS
ncbi:MAG TPA: RsmE family RNA methyltransferase [Pirellulaceae bacterium]|jgi:16S rRNA (uracil1498-N3)-methyltransferase